MRKVVLRIAGNIPEKRRRISSTTVRKLAKKKRKKRKGTKERNPKREN